MALENNHPIFVDAPDETVIWRYLDLAKYISLLESKSLFLTRIDLLGDPAEGHYTKLDRLLAQQNPSLNSHLKNLSKARKMYYASCWHMNQRESASMWSVYTTTDKGIAISATVGKLKEALKLDPRILYFGKVNYIDRDLEHIEMDNVFRAVVSKGKFYEYENEIRLIHWLSGQLLDESNNPTIESSYNKTEYLYGDSPTPGGLLFGVDVDKLIEKVVIAPYVPQWLYDLFFSMTKQYGFNELVEKFQWSSMKEEFFE